MIDYFQYKYEDTKVDIDEVKAFNSNDEFCDLGVELFKEIMILFTTVANVKEQDIDGVEIPLTREEAAIVGNMIRYSKLSVGFIEQFAQHRQETSMIFLRCMVETYINIMYFLKFRDEHTINHYIKESLRQEKDFLDTILKNIKDRGEELPIEKRMLKSIRKSIDISGFSEEEISNSSKWKSKVKARLNQIMDPIGYVLLYGNSSHSIHGNWQDIITHHMRDYQDGFSSNTLWNTPNYSFLHLTIDFSCDLIINFCEHYLPDEGNKQELIQKVLKIKDDNLGIGMIHEQFIQNKSK